MSGRKQHYIPQVLLRAFSASPDAKAPPIYVYSRDRGHYRTNTKDAATEREFYSPLNPEGATLDDSITDYENLLARQLADLKALQLGKIPSELPAAIIAHLAIRTDHTRKMFAKAGEHMMGAIGRAFKNESAVRTMMGLARPHSQSELKQELRKTLREKYPGLDRNQRARMEAATIAKLSKEFGKFFEQQLPTINAVTTKLENSVDDLARSSHVKALEKTLAPESRISALEKLQWRIFAGDFLLPDCVAIAIHPDQTASPYMLNANDSLHTVFMPITSQLGMIGTTSEEALIPSSIANEWAASCSSDFFIHPRDNDTLKSLIDRIGTRTLEVITEATDEAIRSSTLSSNNLDP